MFGFLNFIGLLACLIGIPSSLNQTVSDEEVAKYEAQFDLAAETLENQ